MGEWLSVHVNEHNILGAVKQTYRWRINASPLAAVAGTQLVLRFAPIAAQTELLQDIYNEHKVAQSRLKVLFLIWTKTEYETLPQKQRMISIILILNALLFN